MSKELRAVLKSVIIRVWVDQHCRCIEFGSIGYLCGEKRTEVMRGMTLQRNGTKNKVSKKQRLE